MWLEVLAASVEPSTRRNYGTGLLRFTQFCDRHNISETLRMPASELLLALFVAEEGAGHVSGGTIASWLSGLQLWHTFNNAAWVGGQVLRQTRTGASALAPLSSSRPPRPPVTLLLLRTLKSGLTLSNTRDAAIWAVACTAWQDCCRLGELVPPSKASFDPARHVDLRDMTVHSRISVFPLVNDGCTEGIAYARINTGESVVQANPQCDIVWNDKARSGRKQRRSRHHEQSKEKQGRHERWIRCFLKRVLHRSSPFERVG